MVKKKEDKELEYMHEAMDEMGLIEQIDEAQKPSDLVGHGLPEAINQILRPLEIKLVQPTTTGVKNSEGEDIKPGMFYNPAKGKAEKEIEVVILGFTLERIYFDPEEDSSEILCRSMDSITGTEYGFCETCEFQKWKNGAPPPCRQFFRFVVLTEEGQPFTLRAKGSSFKNAKNYVNGIIGNQKPLFGTKTVIKAREEKSKLGKYYVIEFERGDELKMDQIKECARLSRRIMTMESPNTQEHSEQEN